MLMLGGENAWKKYVKGDIVVTFQWVNGEPAMILFPKVKRTLHSGAFALCMSAAHLYVNSDGYPIVSYLAPKSIEIAKALGMDADRSTCHRIADVILDGMEDLLMMPPERPTSHKEKNTDVVGEVVIRDGGRIIHEGEMTAPTINELREQDATVH